MKKIKKPSDSLLIGWIICGLGALFYCYEYLLRIAPSVMSHHLMSHFYISATSFGVLTAFYYYAYTPLQLFVGIMHDRYGPRRILTGAVLLCAIGSLIFGSTNSFYLAAFGRFLVGFGSAFAFVGVLKLAANWLPSERYAMFTGLATALGMVGAMAGDISIAHSISWLGWQKTIFVGTIMGFVLCPIIWFFVRDRKPSLQHVAVIEVSYKEALTGILRMLRNSQMWLAGIVGALLYLSLSVFAETWGPLFLEKTHHFSLETASTINTAIFAGWLAGGPIAGWISDKISNRRLPLVVGSIAATILISIIIYTSVIPTWLLCTLLFLFGAFCSAEVICFAIGHENSPPALTASAVALINCMVMLGGAVLQPLFGNLLDIVWNGTLQHGIRIYSANDYRIAMSIIPAALLISTILTFFIHETHTHMVISDDEKT